MDNISIDKISCERGSDLRIVRFYSRRLQRPIELIRTNITIDKIGLYQGNTKNGWTLFDFCKFAIEVAREFDTKLYLCYKDKSKIELVEQDSNPFILEQILK